MSAFARGWPKSELRQRKAPACASMLPSPLSTQSDARTHARTEGQGQRLGRHGVEEEEGDEQQVAPPQHGEDAPGLPHLLGRTDPLLDLQLQLVDRLWVMCVVVKAPAVETLLEDSTGAAFARTHTRKQPGEDAGQEGQRTRRPMVRPEAMAAKRTHIRAMARFA